MSNDLQESKDSIKGELINLGVYAETNIADINLKGKKVFKIDEELVPQFDQVFKIIPQICLEASNSSDIYKVTFDKGLGSLQKVAGKQNVFRGSVVDANNKYVSGVEMTHLSSAPQVIGGVFTVMSMATGQYYMAEINKSLKKIEKEVHEVYQFLENDKKSKLSANEAFLKKIQKNLSGISNNQSQQIATITTIQDIERQALGDIDFYRNEIESLYSKYNNKTKADEVIDVNKRLGQNIYQYWYALYIYCFSTYLEPILAGNIDSSFLENSIGDMLLQYQQFNESFLELQEKMKYYISNTKGFETNKVLSKATEILNHEPNIIIPPVEACLILLAATANAAEKHDNKKVSYRLKEAKSIPEISQIKKDLDSVDLFRKQLGLYESLYNNKLEVIKTTDAVYVKYE